MKIIIIKVLLILGFVISANNAFAECWPWDNCSGGDMNISIKNDTGYVLTLNNLSTHRASTVTFPIILQPGDEQNLSIKLSGSTLQSVNANIIFDVLAAVSTDSEKPKKIDSIKQTIHYHWGCLKVPHGCLYDANRSYWGNLVGSHKFYITEKNGKKSGISPAYMDGISVNVSSQGNNTKVYDYTQLSNNPTDLPQGSNAWNPTDYAPSPYYSDVGK